MVVTLLKANKATKWPTGDRVDTAGCFLTPGDNSIQVIKTGVLSQAVMFSSP